MINLIKKLMQDDAGQDLAEYGIALAVIGVAAGVAAVAIAADVSTLWNTASGIIDTAA
jgi:Flp pilus assembly pilin Flp